MFYMQHFSKQVQAIIIANQWAKSFPGPAPRLTLFSIVFNLFLFWCERFFSLQNRLFVHFIWIATKIYVANDIPKPPTKNNGNLCAWKQCEFIGVISSILNLVWLWFVSSHFSQRHARTHTHNNGFQSKNYAKTYWISNFDVYCIHRCSCGWMMHVQRIYIESSGIKFLLLVLRPVNAISGDWFLFLFLNVYQLTFIHFAMVYGSTSNYTCYSIQPE